MVWSFGGRGASFVPSSSHLEGAAACGELSTEYRCKAAMVSLNLGVLQWAAGRRPEADRSLASSRDTLEKLIRENPDVTAYQSLLRQIMGHATSADPKTIYDAHTKAILLQVCEDLEKLARTSGQPQLPNC